MEAFEDVDPGDSKIKIGCDVTILEWNGSGAPDTFELNGPGPLGDGRKGDEETDGNELWMIRFSEAGESCEEEWPEVRDLS